MHPINRFLKPFGVKFSRPKGKLQLNRTYPIALDYKIYPKVRWTEQEPNKDVLTILKNQISVYRKNLDQMNSFPLLNNISLSEADGSPKPRWKNDFISPLD